MSLTVPGTGGCGKAHTGILFVTDNRKFRSFLVTEKLPAFFLEGVAGRRVVILSGGIQFLNCNDILEDDSLIECSKSLDNLKDVSIFLSEMS
ncbi:hypothetical protein NX722_02220 [Endozoicomonas gorgoniicola]|uniref:Uncharacterized protein n=1 Tax=Endozoicomonas gorgoniicola TaxID=1234144 RepID=A0ABT3MQ28_9GAMM|nr:hypothetical protein [Endozoicomonas gorgoniicola]MCW7551475.1 hypothetical protein [Endozoicomonas gorgoniicola]